jgi:hypothetical protein
VSARAAGRRSALGTAAAACAFAIVVAPLPATALEARYDHRDQSSLSIEPLLAYDVVAISGRSTHAAFRPGLRLAYAWDVLGEGNELFLGVQGKLGAWSDANRQDVLLALDARYRAYFGTEEWKTFFDVGVWAPLRSRLAVGPLVGIGVAYDYDRSGGFYANGSFGTGFGQARIATFTLGAGWQKRW